MGELGGKIALVTGGTRGIGLACATRLAELGADVVITGTSQSTVDTGLRALKDAGVARASGHQADVRDQGSIDRLFDAVLAEHGRVDVLVKNAGVGGGGWTHEIAYEVWERLIDINLNGAFRTTRTWLLRSGATQRGAVGRAVIGEAVGFRLLRGIFGRGGFFAVPVRFGRNVRILESRTEREGEKRAAGLTTLSQIS